MRLNQETKDFIKQHQDADWQKLPFMAAAVEGVDVAMVMDQLKGKRMATQKLPSWAACEEVIYPPHLSMEQCSSEGTARYKASLLRGASLVDLTGGFGVDCSLMAQHFQQATYVERQEVLCELAQHNFAALGLTHIEVCHDDGVEYLSKMDPVDCIFLDPARRSESGGKVVAISDCEPDVAQLEPLLLNKAKQVLVKLSPMLDVATALRTLQHCKEVHIVSVGNECKELLLLLEKECVGEPKLCCVNLERTGQQLFEFTKTEEQDTPVKFASSVQQYLYEPNASLLKAGAFRILPSRYPVAKLHANSHLYTSSEWLPAFPGRKFEVEGYSSFAKKEVKALLSDTKQANIAVRNFPDSVAVLRKKLKLKEGGQVYLFASTLADGKHVLIRCKQG